MNFLVLNAALQTKFYGVQRVFNSFNFSVFEMLSFRFSLVRHIISLITFLSLALFIDRMFLLEVNIYSSSKKLIYGIDT